ncbi:hemagglutinin repeat-containing protein [Fusobacterium animalis]
MLEVNDKVKAKSVDIYAKNDVNILGDNGVEILTANNTYDKTTKQSSSRIGASVSRPLDYSEAYYNYKEKQANLRESDDCSGIIKLQIDKT